MRLILIILVSLVTEPVFGQWDSLLGQSFNERIIFIDKILSEPVVKNDSVLFYRRTDSLLTFAQNAKHRRFALEIRGQSYLVDLKYQNKELSDFENAFSGYLEEVEAEDYLQLISLAYFDFAEILWYRFQMHTKAIQLYEAAYEYASLLSHDEFVCKQWIFFKLGERYYYLNDYNTAINLFEKAVAIPDNSFKKDASISIYNTMGLAHLNLNEEEKAEQCYLEGLQIAKERGIPVWMAILSGNLGNIYIKNGNTKKGRAMLREDIKLSLARGARNPAAGAILRLAELSIQENNIEEAERLVDSALLLFKGKINDYRKSALFPTLSKIHQSKGEWKEAALYLDSTLHIKERLFKKENKLQAVRAAQRLELEESRVEIAEAEASNRKKTMQLYGVVAGLFLALGAGTVILQQKRKTDAARKRSDELLLNILPANVAEELKATGRAQARKFNEVSVLFSDFKSFTAKAEEMSPEALVKVLDDYFRAFDTIMEEEGLEKIKTIGDAYMGVCGLPQQDQAHAIKVVKAAIRMQEHMAKSPYGWQLRIGIHTGPVVAGIVGNKKFAYDIWGDTVNTAARMEQNSEPGHINISKTTYEKVRVQYPCRYRGKIAAKNKGDLEMYFVEG